MRHQTVARAFGVAAATACVSLHTPPLCGVPSPMRILYFDIDSLRADHLGVYGYARDTSPFLDGLAAMGQK